MQKYEKSFNIVLFHVKYVSLHSIKNNQLWEKLLH